MNKNQCKGWKVITIDRMSITEKANNYAVRYPVNKEVFPKLKGSKLFFFKSKKNAQKFVDKQTVYNLDSVSLKIVPCIATNPKIERFVAYFCNSISIKDMWSREPVMSDKPPKGTYVADSIKCLE